ncbi:MAG TPA: STAS domain-containing protein [Acidimicrobiales bacterium]|jgi:anti-anti-sigma factor|nr:STAS domain-containing protein [Acidimicrobiales bacterium]
MSYQDGISIEVVGSRRSCWVWVSGEIDTANAWRLSDVAATLVDLGVDDVALDLADVTFVDAAGWRAVKRVAHLLENAGAECRLEQLSPVVRRTSRFLAGHPAGSDLYHRAHAA